MAEVQPVNYDEGLVREVIRKIKTHFKETLHLDKILDHLYAKNVIDTSQHDELTTYKETKGRIYATEQLLQMILKEKVQIAGFMQILDKQLPWIKIEIDKGLQRFQTGEWILPGKLDIAGKC